jgi:integrase
MAQGHIRRRGAKSWELKFDLGRDPLTGRRLTRYHSFKGTKREAKVELVRLKAAANKGQYVDANKITLGEFLDHWETWAATQVSGKTLERYQQLAKHHIRPHLGESRVQKLRTVHFVELYGQLQRPKSDGGAGLAARTVGHVHRLLHRALGHGVKWGLITVNPVSAAEPPRVEHREVEIPTPSGIRELLHSLRGRVLYPVAVLGLATGMRRGEMVALRWGDVDLGSGKIRIERSLEETRAGLRFKQPKTRAGRRLISIPPSIVAELRAHWRRQQEKRLALGLGKASDDDLVLARQDGTPWRPDALTWEWVQTMRRLNLAAVTLHSLRHAHVSQLIASGLDVVSVSRRIGHSNPTTTLNVYAHLFGDTDERAANIVEAALANILAE